MGLKIEFTIQRKYEREKQIEQNKKQKTGENEEEEDGDDGDDVEVAAKQLQNKL